ncbi:MAG TPA: lysylphosphatidylglycerol synthase transmembrane domain-containing protein [Chthoniobacterales bacterium]
MKRLITTSLQIALTAALLYWVLHDPAKRAAMADSLRAAKPEWLAAALVCIGLGFGLQIVRWNWLLKTLDIALPPLRVVRLYFVGLFFNLFIPGGTGGDLVKIYYTAREKPDQKYGAAMSVILDRVFGMLALILIGGVIGTLFFHALMATPITRGMLFMVAGIFAASLAVVILAWIVEAFQLAGRIPAWMPLRHSILELAAGFSAVARRPRTVLACIGISLPAHGLLFLCFYCVARALTDQLSLAAIFSVLPITQTIASLPISFGGLGVREEAFQQLLGTLYHTPIDKAALISLGGYSMALIWGLAGGAVYLTYRTSQGGKVSLHAARQEAETLEHDLEKSP